MAVRIAFYAVDLVPFEQFLQKSLREALQFVAENGREDHYVWFQMSPAGRYFASSKYGILDGTQLGQEYVQMSAADVDADPNLSVSCREHLAQGNVSELSSLLWALAGCSGLPWVKELSGGHRRWWIGSLLDWAEGSDALGADEYAQYEDLFFKVLRGYSCAKLPAVKWSRLSSTDFPVTPADTDAVRLGVWTAEEVDLFVLTTQYLLSFEPQFGAPRGFRDRSTVESNAEWNDWVHGMLEQLLNITTLGYDTPNMVSFIG